MMPASYSWTCLISCWTKNPYKHISFNFYQEFNLYKKRQDSSSSVFFWRKPNSIQDFVVILHS